VGKVEIVELLEEELDADALTLNSRAARYAVTAWYNPALMLKDYLQNRKVDVLFSVKRAIGVSSRILQQVAHTDRIDYEVGIWLIDAPGFPRSDKDVLRDAALAEVSRIFKANPEFGTEKAVKEDDHAKGHIWVLNSIVTVTNKQYS
jgi:hypothetical protein